VRGVYVDPDDVPAAIPCPQGMLQGFFANRHAIGRFVCRFVQLPQWLVANSCAWPTGKPDRMAGNFLPTADNF
jgi:hypothetical protein